ncbi:MAG: NADH-quinone oxidoreductase subunit H [Actinomycetota bacterium]|nr:NADH-quinone oxidoreductase subunit H [Actinomycetota bacterium]
MAPWIWKIIACVAFIVLGPFIGGLLAGIDRKISARMQRRVGPPIRQPFYDVGKLLAKENASDNATEHVYVWMYLIMAVIAGCIFFSGGNFLLVSFILTLGSLFFIIAAYSTRSPYAEVGAGREILQVMTYEPMVILVAVGFYMVTGSFNVVDIAAGVNGVAPTICWLPLMFIGFCYILTIKLRKSPFDLAMSAEAHQELVKGITTEMSGKTLAIVEIAEWYETVMFLGWVALFVSWASWVGVIVCLVCLFLIYFFEILVDNNFARVKWDVMFKSSWWLAFVFGALNLAAIQLIQHFVM